ncbi:hypothetical protein BC937DRAFT_88717 [Endogone sp. FLAS-F59071]|nr:hypothetical protein BC937DRAFT_88717 [Endogone sp. FLAS-F59071]|eukprot:RUS22504.1 hypothetical protein BC937DRAFT_88717 [Endogone sp. FLAS-F59071]
MKRVQTRDLRVGRTIHSKCHTMQRLRAIATTLRPASGLDSGLRVIYERDIWDIGMERALTRLAAAWHSPKLGTRGFCGGGEGDGRRNTHGDLGLRPASYRKPQEHSNSQDTSSKKPSKPTQPELPHNLVLSPPPSPLKEKTILLSHFNRALSTQDFSSVWPAYQALHRHRLTRRLTRRTYYQLFMYAARLPNTIENLHKLLSLLDDMKDRGMMLRLPEYNALVHWVGGETVPRPKDRHLAEAMTLFDDLQHGERVSERVAVWPSRRDDGLTHRPYRTPPTYDDHVDASPQHLSSHRSILPDVVTFNTLIRIACEVHDLRTAQRFYDDMISREVRPDIYTYTTLIHAFAKSGNVEAMEQMYRAIPEEILRKVGVTTWNVMMQGYMHAGEMTMVEKIFERMKRGSKEEGAPRADRITYQVFAEALVRDGQMERALKIVELMESEGTLSVSLFNTLFAVFVREENGSIEVRATEGLEWGKAKSDADETSSPLIQNEQSSSDTQPSPLTTLQKIYAMMKRLRIRPNLRTFRLLVYALLDHGDKQSALHIFAEMSGADGAGGVLGVILVPDVQILERMREVLDILQELTEKEASSEPENRGQLGTDATGWDMMEDGEQWDVNQERELGGEAFPLEKDEEEKMSPRAQRRMKRRGWMKGQEEEEEG